MIAWLRLRAGEWDEAERLTRREMESGIVVRLLAKTVLAELAVRRGDPDAGARLAELAAEADRTGELQRIVPLLELAAEWALTTGAPMPVERFEKLAELPTGGIRAGRFAMRVAAWAAVAGSSVDGGAADVAAARRDGAARLAGGGRRLRRGGVDVRPGADAVAARRRGGAGRGDRDRPGLGAEPLTRRVAGRMRELGLRVPGPREATPPTRPG